MPFAVLRELRPVESDEPSVREDCFGPGADSESAGRFSLVSVAGRDGLAAMGVVVTEDSVEDDEGSPMGGNGRTDNSGRGLYEFMELGVDAACC